MNYRHVFHAGNFADLIKHAVLTQILMAMTAPESAPLMVIDTHAGAGVYDLDSPEAAKTGEGSAVDVLISAPDAPAVFDTLKKAIAALGGVRRYPGSPSLIAAALRPGDRYLACEARTDDHHQLTQVVSSIPTAQPILGDGWRTLEQRAPPAPARVLVLIDPPFEAADDGALAIQAARSTLRLNPAATVAIWLPVKDLTTFDAWLGDLEDNIGAAPLLFVEVRLRPLDDPTRLNGCAILVANPPSDLERPAQEAAAWVARTFGEAGCLGRARYLT